MLAARKKSVAEPETLRRHREMYESRLRYLRMNQGKSEKEVVDRANDPRIYRKAADSSNKSRHEHELHPPEGE
jgi:hypothetical protein